MPRVRLIPSAIMMAICILRLRSEGKRSCLASGKVALRSARDEREDCASRRIEVAAGAKERVRLGVFEEEKREERKEEGDSKALE
jgi:hypothetical protein